MKSNFVLLAVWVLMTGLVCCKPTVPEVGPGNPTPPEAGQPGQTGTVTAVGEPQGALISQRVGPAGGTLRADDGRFTVQIPAGALTSDVTIGVQALTNTNVAGKGVAYRLTPHGQRFAKTVTLTVQYTEKELGGTLPEALGIAYQNADRVWMAVGGVRLDTTRRTVSIPTTHFSDWSFFESIHLDASAGVIDPGQTVKLSVRRYINDDAILAPLTQEGWEAALSDETLLLDKKDVQRWQLIGEGTLTAVGSTADYQAPARIPSKNPVEVSARIRLPNGAIGILIRKIYVVPPGISVQLNGGAWRTIPGGGMNKLGERYQIDGFGGDEGISVHWHGGPAGTFNWTLETVICQYMPTPRLLYQHIYGLAPYISGGSVTAEEAGEYAKPDIVVGHFDVEPAGMLDVRVPEDPKFSTASLRGVFRVRRLY